MKDQALLLVPQGLTVLEVFYLSIIVSLQFLGLYTLFK